MLRYLRRGMSNSEIAVVRGTSIDAVKYHMANIRRKLAMEDRSDLMEWPGMPSIPAPGINIDQEVGRMIRDFDVNPRTGEIAVWVVDYDQTSRVDIVTRDGKPAGEIPSTYISQWPRWSRAGRTSAFSETAAYCIEREGTTQSPRSFLTTRLEPRVSRHGRPTERRSRTSTGSVASCSVATRKCTNCTCWMSPPASRRKLRTTRRRTTSFPAGRRPSNGSTHRAGIHRAECAAWVVFLYAVEHRRA